MNPIPNKVSLTIDGRPAEVPAGTSLLDAARSLGIDLPVLCSHEGLTPFGGCRLCIVEVEGQGRFPAACTTPAASGMVVHTETPALQAARREIFRLILSEHPAGCLLCGERESCGDAMITVRKAGVASGCSNCPKNGACELQRLALRLGVDGFEYPLRYRGIPVQKDDPFIDRDYNLCVLCGRCVRACQEHRLASVLTFKMRGPETLVGPAFDATYLEAGCEFCGSCLEACPTGALSERAVKWLGRPEASTQTTCLLCGLGCQLEVRSSHGQVCGVCSVSNDPVSHGQLCVKGRFALPELVNAPDRLKQPLTRTHGQLVPCDWDQALDAAVTKLRACPPDQFGLLVSPDCTNEDIYIAQKFALEAMGSSQVDAGLRGIYREALPAYLRLFACNTPLTSLDTADVILAVGLDTRFTRSVVGSALQRARRRGARLITIHPHEHNLARPADLWLRPSSGEGLPLVRWLAGEGELPAGCDPADAPRLARASQMLRKASHPVILVGPAVSSAVRGAELLAALKRLAVQLNAGILPLPAPANLVGVMWQGVSLWDPAEHLKQKRLQVLYSIGQAPVSEVRPRADFIIFQDLFAPKDPDFADLVLPSAAFTEVEGTILSGEGRLRRVNPVVPPPGLAMPDWQILCQLARRMGVRGFEFKNVAEVQAEMAVHIPRWTEWLADENPHPLSLETLPAAPYSLDGAGFGETTYRAYPLAERVSGLRNLQ